MSKINSFDDLKKIQAGYLENEKKQAQHQVIIKISMATCGIASGAKPVMDYFRDELEKRNIAASIIQTGCMGFCYAEPTVEIALPGAGPVIFGFVNKSKADEIIEKYIKNGELVDGIIPVTFINYSDKQKPISDGQL
jgi:NADP-reducing hydrogenase subunit HndB